MEESNNRERFDGPEVLDSYQRRTQKVRQRKPGGIPPQFPRLLHTMLCRADDGGFGQIVSWRPHGKSFTVYDREKFVKDVMPRYFQQTKYTSFQRQLNLYGFRRINETGPDYNGYYHEKFVRDHPELVDSIARVASKTSPPSSLSPSPQPSAGFYEHSTPSSGLQAFLPNSSFQLNLYPSIPTHIPQPDIPLTLAARSNTSLPSTLPFAPGNTMQTETVPFQTAPQHYPFHNHSQPTPNFPPSYNAMSYFINSDPSVPWSGGMYQTPQHSGFMEWGQSEQQQQEQQQTFIVQPRVQPPPPSQQPVPNALAGENNADFADVDELVRSTEQLLESLPLTTQNRAGLMAQQELAVELELSEGAHHSYWGSNSTMGSSYHQLEQSGARLFPTEDLTRSEGGDFNETTDMKLPGFCDDSSQHDVEGDGWN